MLSALKLLSVNPWVVVGVLVTLAAAAVGIFAYGVNVGGNAAELACERRVAAILRDYEDKKAEVERLNKEWQARIDALDDAYNKLLVEENKSDAEREKRIEEYERTLAAVDGCTVTDDDLGRVRGK